MNEMYFSFGALAEKFSEQCENQGYKLKITKGKNNLKELENAIHIVFYSSEAEIVDK